MAIHGYTSPPQAFPRNLGEKQSLMIKILLGILLLTALVLLIWGPLLVISLIATTNLPNTPTQVQVKVTLGGFEVNLYHMVKDIFQVCRCCCYFLFVVVVV